MFAAFGGSSEVIFQGDTPLHVKRPPKIKNERGGSIYVLYAKPILFITERPARAKNGNIFNNLWSFSVRVNPRTRSIAKYHRHPIYTCPIVVAYAPVIQDGDIFTLVFLDAGRCVVRDLFADEFDLKVRIITKRFIFASPAAAECYHGSEWE